MVKANRTEICDTTQELFTKPGPLILPRRCDETDRFAQQARNIAKVLEEDPETGSREYRYRKLGEDHFRHTLNYCYLASTKISVAESLYHRPPEERTAQIDFNIFSYDKDKRDGYPF
jgi:hypothetical protein